MLQRHVRGRRGMATLTRQLRSTSCTQAEPMARGTKSSCAMGATRTSSCWSITASCCPGTRMKRSSRHQVCGRARSQMMGPWARRSCIPVRTPSVDVSACFTARAACCWLYRNMVCAAGEPSWGLLLRLRLHFCSNAGGDVRASAWQGDPISTANETRVYACIADVCMKVRRAVPGRAALSSLPAVAQRFSTTQQTDRSCTLLQFLESPVNVVVRVIGCHCACGPRCCREFSFELPTCELLDCRCFTDLTQSGSAGVHTELYNVCLPSLKMHVPES